MYRGITIRLYPTKDQVDQLWNQIGGCRFIWNYMLELQMKRHDQGEKYLKKFDMFKHITQLKKDTKTSWLSEIAVHSLQRVCADLDESYRKFFNHSGGHPDFKSKKRKKQSYPVPAERLYFKDGMVQISMIGKICYKADYDGIDFEALKVFNPRIVFDNEKWILVCAVETGCEIIPYTKGTIGIDLGIKNLAICSYSESDKPLIFENINKTKVVLKLQRKFKHLQRIVARKYEVGNRLHPSKKWQKTNAIKKYERMMARICRHIANIRKDQRCKMIHTLVGLAPSTIVIEDLNVAVMKKNRHMARVVGEMGFFSIRQALKKKCEAKGIDLVIADRFFPSSKTCSNCGTIKKDLRLKDRTFICPECGFEIDRDLNAAINLMNYV